MTAAGTTAAGAGGPAGGCDATRAAILAARIADSVAGLNALLAEANAIPGVVARAWTVTTIPSGARPRWAVEVGARVMRAGQVVMTTGAAP